MLASSGLTYQVQHQECKKMKGMVRCRITNGFKPIARGRHGVCLRKPRAGDTAGLSLRANALRPCSRLNRSLYGLKSERKKEGKKPELKMRMTRLIFVLWVNSIGFAFSGETKITRYQAITLAERIIKENGYTGAPVDKSHYRSESLEFGSDTNSILLRRKGTLKPRAYGTLIGRKSDSLGWTVAFEYTKPENKSEPVGRAVTMDLDGGNIRVEHVSIYLSKVDKINRKKIQK
jgi:hypothetical protein